MKKKREIKDRVYKLRNGHQPLSHTINSRNTRRKPLLYFDGEHNRPLRYASNQKSPFEDEQDKNVILDPVIFEDGMLFVPKTNPVLQEFLHYHPDNGAVFEEVDKEADAQKEVDYLETEAKAFKMAAELTIDQMETLGRVFLELRVGNMATAELKRDILIFAKRNPKLFLDLAEDENVILRNFAINATESGIIKLSQDQRTFTWGTNGRKLMTVPFDENPYSAMAAWFQTDEGLEVYKSIDKKLK